MDPGLSIKRYCYFCPNGSCIKVFLFRAEASLYSLDVTVSHTGYMPSQGKTS